MNYLKDKHIVLLGGGTATSHILRGLRETKAQFTVITSMADDGGSSGRLRKAYNIMPPGDVVNVIAGLIEDKELSELLLYRFPGTSKENKILDGQKLGNLIMLAEIQRTGNFYKAIDVIKKVFHVNAEFLPATDQRVLLSAITKDGRRVHTETTLDLALYSEPYGIKKVYLTPSKPKVNPRVSECILNADLIISGPGDLYTNLLPVMIVPEIKDALLKSKAEKILILNVANKPFETKGFTLKDFIHAFTEHLAIFPFDTVIANNNHEIRIPKKYKYEYVYVDETIKNTEQSFRIIEEDLIYNDTPIYHDPQKLASAIMKLYNK